METHNVTREKPTLTVLEKSRELHILLSKLTLDDNFLAKTFRYTIGKPVTDHSQFIYENLAVANTIDLYDRELAADRKKYQVDALREVTKLLAATRIMYSVGNFSSEKMMILLNQIIEVERLLKKWIESDANRQGMALNIVKKDVIKTDLFNNQITAKDLFETGVHVDFDSLLRDARSMPISERSDKSQVYIPPASSLPKAPNPPKQYVKMTDEERRLDFMKSRFELDKSPSIDLNPPILDRVRPKTDFVLPTRPVQVEIQPAEPIIVPDNIPPPVVEEKDDPNKPLAPGVEIVTGTPEMVVDNDQPDKDEKTPEEQEKETLKELEASSSAQKDLKKEEDHVDVVANIPATDNGDVQGKS